MYKIICKELTGKDCDFVVEEETKEAIKERFYAHGAESEMHKEEYENASQKEARKFSKRIDKYLAAQDRG